MTDLHAIDLSMLTRPVSPSEAKAAGYTTGPIPMRSIIFGGVCVIMIVFGAGILLTDDDRYRPGFMGPFLIIGGLIGVAFSVFYIWRHRARTRRLFVFATRNELDYRESVMSPGYSGMIFGVGNGRVARDVISTRGKLPVEFASYQYTIGSGKNQQTVKWDYVRIRLQSALPNIVLDARSNNLFMSNLPAALQKSQRLSLEGNFDKHFTLYCPEGYETDALYLFTPDVMQNFMSGAKEFDVEIVDNQLFLYAKGNASRLDPANWQWQFRAVEAVLAKVEQWERWRDDRLTQQPSPTFTPSDEPLPSAMEQQDDPITPQQFAAAADPFDRPTGVAPEGRRLRRSSGATVTVISLVVVGLFVLLRFMQ